jgi:hypothetical protein
VQCILSAEKVRGKFGNWTTITMMAGVTVFDMYRIPFTGKALLRLLLPGFLSPEDSLQPSFHAFFMFHVHES